MGRLTMNPARAARRAGERLAFRMLEHLARRLDVDLIRRTPYTPVPHVPPIEDRIWTDARSMPGIALDSTQHLEYVRRALAPYLPEFPPPTAPAAGGFRLDNGYYDRGDAEILYATIRHAAPRRIIELGAGYSTLVIEAAVVRNAAEGRPVEFVSIDPEPRIAGLTPSAGLTRLERRSATTVPIEQFLELEAGDILFVDTSHTVKLGSEVNFLILDVLPRLRPGVLVHFHDIFLPYEYPRAWFARGTYLAEQYLLQAFLIENATYEVVLAVHALVRRYGEELAKLIPSLATRAYAPAAFWIRRR